MREGGCTSRFFLSVFFGCALVFSGAATQAAGANSESKCKEILVAQEKPTVDPPTTQSAEPASNPPVIQARTETEQYTLSHERYEKAVAYSRAGYTLYFVSYFLSAVFLLLILRFGLAAKFRDI